MKKFFNEDGSLSPEWELGDPYRRRYDENYITIKDGTLATEHFDEYGWPSEELMANALAVVLSGMAHPNSLAAALVHICEFCRNSGGADAYPPNYYWR